MANRVTWLAGLAGGLALFAAAAYRSRRESRRCAVEEDLDSTIEDSFPASDPPSTSGAHA